MISFVLDERVKPVTRIQRHLEAVNDTLCTSRSHVPSIQASTHGKILVSSLVISLTIPTLDFTDVGIMINTIPAIIPSSEIEHGDQNL